VHNTNKGHTFSVHWLTFGGAIFLFLKALICISIHHIIAIFHAWGKSAHFIVGAWCLMVQTTSPLGFIAVPCLLSALGTKAFPYFGGSHHHLALKLQNPAFA
jgi:hypothetical protein